ncbi:MAG TPA: YceI family protein [Candidatus Sulfotelmatobacter sp.]|nr:YceI family protein [Candidatus Sulfotelmatobacter sp.]
MKEDAQAFLRSRVRRAILTVLFLSLSVAAAAQNAALQLDPQHTTINFTLGDVLHTVRGTFQLKRGALRLDPASGKLTGEIVVDAKSGQSGNGMRDRKMHREVLESDRYPEIVFRPDRVDGAVSLSGTSSVRVRGIFAIHGAEHELTVPAEVKMAPGYWTATLHFAVPYVQWGIKNPSTLFLQVSESVDIDLTASGNLTQP